MNDGLGFFLVVMLICIAGKLDVPLAAISFLGAVSLGISLGVHS